MKQNGGRVAQLDALRGLAAMLVVLHHGRQAFENKLEDVWTGISAYIDVGRLGVVIFFMISGFVIVKAMPGRDLASAMRFWKHRFFRLYPPFWVSLLLAALIAALAARTDCCAFVVPVTTAKLLANATMIPLRFHQSMLIGIYWTLELELLFYALITICTLLNRNSYRSMSLLACTFFGAAVAVAGSTAIRSGTGAAATDQLYLTLLHLSLMFSGSAVRYHWDEQTTRTSFLTGLPLTLKLYFLAMLGFFIGVAGVKVRHGIDPHTFRVAATYMLAVGTFLGSLRYMSGSRLGTFLGDRSYGIYLLHIPVLSALSLGMSMSGWIHLSYPIYLALGTVLTLLAAGLLRNLVERPAIRLGHRHDRWLNRQTVKPVTSPVSTKATDELASSSVPER